MNQINSPSLCLRVNLPARTFTLGSAPFADIDLAREKFTQQSLSLSTSNRNPFQSRARGNILSHFLISTGSLASIAAFILLETFGVLTLINKVAPLKQLPEWGKIAVCGASAFGCCLVNFALLVAVGFCMRHSSAKRRGK